MCCWSYLNYLQGLPTHEKSEHAICATSGKYEQSTMLKVYLSCSPWMIIQLLKSWPCTCGPVFDIYRELGQKLKAEKLPIKMLHTYPSIGQNMEWIVEHGIIKPLRQELAPLMMTRSLRLILENHILLLNAEISFTLLTFPCLRISIAIVSQHQKAPQSVKQFQAPHLAKFNLSVHWNSLMRLRKHFAPLIIARNSALHHQGVAVVREVPSLPAGVVALEASWVDTLTTQIICVTLNLQGLRWDL